MRYVYVITLLGFVLASGCTSDDPRLHGTWKSDAELSMTWNRIHANLTDKQDSGLSQMFGHMTDTCAPGGKGIIVMEPYKLIVSTNIQTMSGFTNSYTYKVIKRTKDTVVVKITSGIMNEHVVTAHFEGPDTYWLHLNPDKPEKSAREYFKRIKCSNNFLEGTR